MSKTIEAILGETRIDITIIFERTEPIAIYLHLSFCRRVIVAQLKVRVGYIALRSSYILKTLGITFWEC